MSFRIDDILRRNEDEESRDSLPSPVENHPKREASPGDDERRERPSPESSPSSDRRDSKNQDHYAHHHPWLGLSSHANSILQQTLLSRTYPYYRSVSECPNSKLYPAAAAAAFYNCDKVFLPYNHHLDPYADKVSAFNNVYSRNRYWPMYPLTHPVVLPLPYTHYSKRKGGQVRFTASQTDALEKRFNAHKYLSPEDRRVLADSLKLTDRQVKTWFQNRRAKWRRCNIGGGNEKSHDNSDSNNNNNNEEDSEPETDICEDDSPKHDKSNTIIK